MKKSRLFKPLVIALATLAVVAGSLTVPLTLIGESRFRQALQELFSTELGYELTLAGDVTLSFFPRFEFGLEDLRLNNPAYPQELASARRASLAVDIWEFADGRLHVDELNLDGVHINYRLAADGESIWQTPALAALLAGQAEPDNATRLSIGRITVTAGTLEFADVTSGRSFSMHDLELDILEANAFSEPFSLQGQTSLALFSPLHNDEIRLPLIIGAELLIDSEARAIQLDQLRLGASPMLATVSAQLNWNETALSAQGEVSAASFDLDAWLRNIEPARLASDAESQAQPAAFQFDFSADETGIQIQDFDAEIGAGAIDADLTFNKASGQRPANLNYSVRGSRIDFGFLEPNRAAFWSRLPLGLFSASGLNSTGSLDLEELVWGTEPLRDLQLFVSAEGGVKDIELLPLRYGGGIVEGSLRLSQSDSFELNGSLSSVDSNALALHWPRLASFGGEVSASAALVGSGADWPTIARSASGDITFDVRNNLVNLALVKQVFSTVSALSPSGGSTEAWPEQRSFDQLSGFVLLDRGLTSPHRVNLLMDNLEIEGSGSFDTELDNFDYALAFTLWPTAARNQTLEINDAHTGKPWPVRCAANLADAPSQFCSPDFAGVRALFAEPAFVPDDALSPLDALLAPATQDH